MIPTWGVETSFSHGVSMTVLGWHPFGAYNLCIFVVGDGSRDGSQSESIFETLKKGSVDLCLPRKIVVGRCCISFSVCVRCGTLLRFLRAQGLMFHLLLASLPWCPSLSPSARAAAHPSERSSPPVTQSVTWYPYCMISFCSGGSRLEVAV